MSLKIIGAGLPRSGTTSLREALRILGIEPTYYFSDFTADELQLDLWMAARYRHILEGYQAALDYPACVYWRRLADEFPSAKVVLTVRDLNQWWDSAMATIYPATKLRPNRTCGALATDLWEVMFQGRFEDRDSAISTLRARQRRIGRILTDRRLLMFNVEAGWGPLCAFLKRPVPDMPFPHLNRRCEF